MELADESAGEPNPMPVRTFCNDLGSSGTGDAVFEEGNQLRGIAGGREACLAGADDGERFAGGEMRESFLESPGEMELRGFGGHAQNGFAEMEYAVCGGFEGLRGGIIRMAGDDDLHRMIREKRGG